MPVGKAAPQTSWWGSGQAFPLFPSSSTSPRDHNSILPCWVRRPGRCTAPNPTPPQGPAAPHRPHLMRIPVGRASSSLAFLRFCSASSEDLGQSRVRRHCHGPSAPLTPFPPHSRQEILHFLHGDVPGDVQRVLHAAVGGVDGAGREGSRVLHRGPWRVMGQEGLGTARTQSQAWSRAVGHCECTDRVVTHGHCPRGSAGPRSCAGRGCRSPGAASVSPLSCCWKETGRSYGQNQCHGVGVQG